MKTIYKPCIQILSTLIIFTFSWGVDYPASVKIQNVNTNVSGCTDPQYTTRADCEAAAACSEEPTTLNTMALCELDGWFWTPRWYTGVMDINLTSQTGCRVLSTGGEFDASVADAATCEAATTSGGNTWYDGKIGGLQFALKGATISGIDTSSAGGKAISNKWVVNTVSTTLLSFYFGGTIIEAGNGLFAKIYFDNYSVGNICFGEDTGSAGATAVSDANAGYIATNWGDCWCGSAGGDQYADCAGVCAGTTEQTVCDACTSGVFDCAGTCDGGLLWDNCGICDSDSTNDCVQDCNSEWGGSAEVDAVGTCDGSCMADTDTDLVCDDEGTDLCLETATGADVDTDGCSTDQLSISQIGEAIPSSFSISQNFPNPFNPVTSIAFDVAAIDEVSLVVYDLMGKEVVTLASGTYVPGRYQVEWNAVDNAGDGIASGMYIYRYISSEKAITRKMLYLK